VVNNAGVFFTEPSTDYTPEGFETLSGTSAVAPGVVNRPCMQTISEGAAGRSPMGEISDIAELVDAIVYLTEAGPVGREVLRVDLGAHKRQMVNGSKDKWAKERDSR
jgi:hypothetical protein